MTSGLKDRGAFVLQPRLCFFILMFSLLAALSGCGQTGDLYLPEDVPKQKVEGQSSN